MTYCADDIAPAQCVFACVNYCMFSRASWSDALVKRDNYVYTRRRHYIIHIYEKMVCKKKCQLVFDDDELKSYPIIVLRC